MTGIEIRNGCKENIKNRRRSMEFEIYWNRGKREPSCKGHETDFTRENTAANGAQC